MTMTIIIIMAMHPKISFMYMKSVYYSEEWLFSPKKRHIKRVL